MTDPAQTKAIELAMAAEEKAAAYYEQVAQRAADPKGKDLFEQLARFERHHYDRLAAARDALGDGADYPVYEGTDFAAARLGPSAPVDEAARSDLADALQIAIESEKKAAAEYTRLADQAGTDAGTAFFRRLAEEEALHEKVLNDQFYSLTNEGVWTWGD